MLVNLKIKNVALIDNLDISFGDNLNVISGETGSGKSIMLNAMGFVFGDRLDKNLLREGTDHMRVDAFFDKIDAGVRYYIQELTGIVVDNELVITREYYDSGKTVCKINNESANTAILKKVSSRLIDIHGQHEHQSLMDNEYQLDILDMFSKGEVESFLDSLNINIDKLNEIDNQLQGLGGNVEQKQNLIDLYKYQINEIDEANIKPNEYDEICLQIKEMKSYEKIVEKLQQTYNNLCDNPYMTPASELINDSVRQTMGLNEFGEKYSNINNRLDSVSVEIDDICKTISGLISECNFDANKLQQLDERADFIKDLFRKYGGDYENLVKYYDDISLKLKNLINSEEVYNELTIKRNEILKTIYGIQDRITEIRTRNAIDFSNQIEKEIRLLGMPNAKIEIKLSKRGEQYTRRGQDLVEFMFSANIGFELKPLSKIASGGELSRFMLAYKIVVAELDGIDTLIFDEIDTGLSGQMAYVVAQCLARLSKHKQVVTISHLPQLACMADDNFKVEKYSDSSTHTKLTKIENWLLYQEIARLMGLSESEQSINVAKEYKEKCNQYKQTIK